VWEPGLVLEEVELLRRKEDAVREVEEIRERELVACEVLLLGQNGLVRGHLAIEHLSELSYPCLVSLGAHHWREDTLVHDDRRIGLEVGDLDGRRLLEERRLLCVARGEKGRLRLGGNVASDCAGLVDDEAIVILRQ
jgi:hypothetical protein